MSIILVGKPMSPALRFKSNLQILKDYFNGLRNNLRIGARGVKKRCVRVWYNSQAVAKRFQDFLRNVHKPLTAVDIDFELDQ
jgi:hypothetical protein